MSSLGARKRPESLLNSLGYCSYEKLDMDSFL